jgi:DNA-binding transcriptional regulator YdaS (Cro superfamily)
MTPTQQILSEQFSTRGEQSALARQIGVTRQAVSLWVTGATRPSSATVARMVRSDNARVRAVGVRLMEALHPELAQLSGQNPQA